MRYESSKTAHGNVGVSYTSQQAADDQAAQMDANGCTDCTRCTDCTDCTGCTGCKEQPLQLIGLRWVVTVRKNKTIQIGCQDHSLAFWKRAGDETIGAMDADAPAFWAAHKATILALAGVAA